MAFTTQSDLAAEQSQKYDIAIKHWQHNNASFSFVYVSVKVFEYRARKKLIILIFYLQTKT